VFNSPPYRRPFLPLRCTQISPIPKYQRNAIPRRARRHKANSQGVSFDVKHIKKNIEKRSHRGSKYRILVCSLLRKPTLASTYLQVIYRGRRRFQRLDRTFHEVGAPWRSLRTAHPFKARRRTIQAMRRPTKPIVTV
jgi:hypothetical protein